MADRVISKRLIQKIYRESMIDNSKAIEYLKSERGYDESMTKDSVVGYIDYLKLDEKGFFLKQVLVFPLFDAKGVLRGIVTRKTVEKWFIRFVSDSYPLIFSDYEFATKTLVLTESIIDALPLQKELTGMSVGATLSASMTVQQLTMLSTAKKIITVLDNDEAGKRCSEQIAGCNPNTFSVPIHLYEDFNDMNELLKNDIESYDSIVKYIKLIERKT